MARRPVGWRNESTRHSLASKGIKTGQKTMIRRKPVFPVNVSFFDVKADIDFIKQDIANTQRTIADDLLNMDDAILDIDDAVQSTSAREVLLNQEDFRRLKFSTEIVSDENFQRGYEIEDSIKKAYELQSDYRNYLAVKEQKKMDSIIDSLEKLQQSTKLTRTLPKPTTAYINDWIAHKEHLKRVRKNIETLSGRLTGVNGDLSRFERELQMNIRE